MTGLWQTLQSRVSPTTDESGCFAADIVDEGLRIR